MHLVTKQVKGHEYFYLVEKGRRDGRVVTTRTVYIGDRRKLADMLQQNASDALPSSFTAQSVGAALALATIATDLGMEQLIDQVCPVRTGAAPIGRRLVLAAIHRLLAARRDNGLDNLRRFYEASVLAELLPIDVGALDGRRMSEVLSRITSSQVEQIEASVVKRLVEREAVTTQALAFDCTNFDSYAGAKTPSRLLQRGHSKSGRSLRVLGMGLLASEDDGMPLLTFAYPGNQNDVTAFKRFLRALDRRRDSLHVSLDTTIAADGGNISKQVVHRLEKGPRHYVLRLPVHHATALQRSRRDDLPALAGRFKGKVWAKKHVCDVYGKQRCIVEVYSKRMHERQLPGLVRDRKRALEQLHELQRLLERQQQGRRRHKPLTVAVVERRAEAALAREHMRSLFDLKIAEGERGPTLSFEERKGAWQHLQDYELGRTLLVTNRADWSSEQIVHAGRIQSHNERLFRDLKDPDGASMLPLRHRRDPALRVHALLVILGLILGKVAQRRLRKAGLKAPTLASVLEELKQVQRARLELRKTAAPALRALAADTWIPSKRTARQVAVLQALNIADRAELGTTIAEQIARKKPGRRAKLAA